MNQQRPSTARAARGQAQHARLPRYDKKEIRRNRIIAVLVLLVLLGILGFLGYKVYTTIFSPSSQGVASTDAASAPTDAPMATSDTVSLAALLQEPVATANAIVESAQTTAANLPEQSAPSSRPDPDDLSWRDADFAVDASRTDWNYEGNGRKVVYLTIDDGPSANTQAVLDILDKYNCKATFFVVGHNADYFPMIAEAYSRGHTIGLHSLTHDYAYVYSSQQAFFEDLYGIGNIVADQIGYVPCFIRFPGGSSNAVSAEYTKGIMTALTGEVQARGFQYFDWNVSCGDGSGLPWPACM